ncbi:tyrosine-protein phosphatase [Novosphingobium subterraneum]|uniref:tyrosine-protein phosphatase n=1 Tax=Novosphingobium subterraneum TaxID=48936 RepID=UPI003D012098
MSGIRSQRLLSGMIVAAVAGAASPALAIDDAVVTRIDSGHVAVEWKDADPVSVFVSAVPQADRKGARAVVKADRSGRVVVASQVNERRYFLLRDHGDRSVLRVAERVLPLEQGSNFRDIGGYKGADGKHVAWGKVFRSGAMPLLTEADYGMLEQLKISTIVDLRSTDERMIAPNMLDDRTGAIFISNDYSLKGLMANYGKGDGEYAYRGMDTFLKPQLRQVFASLLRNEGAVMYHCSAGQDRTGITTALIYSALGVDRATILKDYHLSTELRRPQFEMPPLDPADWPGNPIVPYYLASMKKPGGPKAEPLFTSKGNSHLAQFLEMVEKDYGSVAAYLDKELGVDADDIKRLKALYLE